MATEGGFLGLDISLAAQADYSTTGQFRFMSLSGADAATMCVSYTTGGSAGAFGILQNAPSSGRAATVRILGMSKCVADAAISAGALISCSTQGRAVTAASTGYHIVGRANTASTAAGQIIEVFLLPLGAFSAGATA